MFVQEGIHNASDASNDRLLSGHGYEDNSTVCVIPTRGVIPIEVVMSWHALLLPPNQRFVRIPVKGMEVGQAYNAAIDMILSNPGLADYKFMLTMEEDNVPPPDGLIKLVKAMHETGYAAISGLYYTKGEGGVPQIWGDPKVFPPNHTPQPRAGGETIQECRGIGMGFALWDLDLFRARDDLRPFFVTEQSWDPGKGARAMTQDLYFWDKAAKSAGGPAPRCAVHNGVRVGHLDVESGMIW
jgi:hypothetical protein